MKLTARGSVTANSLCILILISWIIFNSMFIATSIVLFLLFTIEAIHFHLLSKNLKRLKFERNVDQKPFFVGDFVNINLTIKNMGNKRLSKLDIEDKIPNTFLITSGFNRALINLDGECTYKLNYSAIPLENGQHSIKGISIRFYDPLMLFWTSYEVDLNTVIKVYPKIQFMDTIKNQKILLPRLYFGTHQLQKGGLGTEFYEIRNYNLGDDYKLIAWKAVAHSPEHELMIKLQEKQKSMKLFIVICNDKAMDDGYIGRRKINKVVEAILSLLTLIEEENQVILTFFNQYGKVRVESFLGKDRFIRALNILNEIKPVMMNDPLKLLDYVIINKDSKAMIILILNPISNIEPLLSKLKVMKIKHNLIHLFILDTSKFLPSPNNVSIEVKNAYELLNNEERLNIEKLYSACVSKGLLVKICGPDDLLDNLIHQYLLTRLQV
ncbi:MAG: DUF58 domain-containing protein [Nitrososphaerales archaeon]